MHAGLRPSRRRRAPARRGWRPPAGCGGVRRRRDQRRAGARAADLGIAAGAGATDAAIETADVALVSSDIGRIPWLVRHSRRTLAVIRANVSFALAIKALFVALALAGHASLWAAIAADMGASLLVIANALRLLRS
jgi:cation transport ATPase